MSESDQRELNVSEFPAITAALDTDPADLNAS